MSTEALVLLNMIGLAFSLIPILSGIAWGSPGLSLLGAACAAVNGFLLLQNTGAIS